MHIRILLSLFLTSPTCLIKHSQDSKESRLPSLLSYSVVKEPATFDRVGSVLRTICFFAFRPHRRSRVGIMYNLVQPLVISTAYGPARLSAAFDSLHAPGSSQNCGALALISTTAPGFLFGSPCLQRG